MEKLEQLRQLNFLEEIEGYPNGWLASYRFRIPGTKYHLDYSSENLTNKESLVWRKSPLLLLNREDLEEVGLASNFLYKRYSKELPLEDVLEDLDEDIQEQIIFNLDLLTETCFEPPSYGGFGGDIVIKTGIGNPCGETVLITNTITITDSNATFTAFGSDSDTTIKFQE